MCVCRFDIVNEWKLQNGLVGDSMMIWDIFFVIAVVVVVDNVDDDDYNDLTNIFAIS